MNIKRSTISNIQCWYVPLWMLCWLTQLRCSKNTISIMSCVESFYKFANWYNSLSKAFFFLLDWLVYFCRMFQSQKQTPWTTNIWIVCVSIFLEFSYILYFPMFVFDIRVWYSHSQWPDSCAQNFNFSRPPQGAYAIEKF